MQSPRAPVGSLVGRTDSKFDEQSDAHGAAVVGVLKWNVFCRRPVIAGVSWQKK
jgi:hypothetical protein